ncbi:MAG: ATP-binding cassette domain-containing protein [Cytophagales bacterium]|nr:ATP-binding cassette domain-containing protein [Cytophagales bacterium]
MNEYLLKAIIRLLAIVAKGNVSEDCREKIKFIVYRQASSENAEEYLKIFDDFTRIEAAKANRSGLSEKGEMDAETEEFVEEWANIMLICKRINLESSLFQKVIVLLRVIELSHVVGELSERQDNLIYYIGQTLNIDSKVVKSIRQFVFGREIVELYNDNILIVDDGSEEEYKCCKHIERPNLTGFLAVLYIPEIESYIVKYVGISNVLLNGAAMNSRFTYIFPPGSNIRGSKLKPIYYSDVTGKFKAIQDVSKIQLTSDDIWVRFKQGRIGLRNIYLNEQSGKLVGIMGASGSGKSTLLETLNGQIKPRHGQVIINGIDVHKEPEKLEGLIGYVPQDDLLIEDLTVYENLYYAAKLCFADFSEEELRDRVNKTLQTLGIYETKDLKVGNPLQKTISGGQRKRLNIALELLREPALLFLDEPTSGLSSRDSENILDLLKELSLKGKLVITTIHQPSSDIFKMFDNLLLLDVGGYQIYYGDPVDAIVYFRDVVNMIQRDQGSCVTCGNVSVEQVFNIIETRVVNEYGKFTDQRRISPKEWGDHFKKRLLPGIGLTNKDAPLPATTFKIPTWIDQFKVFYRREVLSKLKNKQYMIVNFAEAPLLGLIIGYFIRYYNPGDDNLLGYRFSDNPNIPYYFLMSIIVALFVGLSISGEEIIKDRRILQRERFLNLSKTSYLTSKVIILFGISAIQTFTFVIIGNLLLEFKGMFLSYWFVLFSSACVANLIGLIISSAFNSVITIYIMVPIILIPQLMFNGVAIEFDKLNPRISSSDKVPLLGDLMTSRWAYEAIMVRQFKENEYEKYFYDWDKTIADSDYKTAYYLTALDDALTKCSSALRGDERRDSIAGHLDLIKYELRKELRSVDREQLIDWEKLDPHKFDSITYASVENVLSTLRTMYINQRNKAFDQKQDWKKTNIIDRDLENLYFDIQNSYSNNKINSIVKNTQSLKFILEVKNRLIRKTTPIYATPEIPDNPLDFRTFFYAPVKYFGGIYMDTYWFNLAIIWGMAFLALIALYMDLLKKFLNLFVKIGDYKFRKQIRKAENPIRKQMGKYRWLFQGGSDGQRY